MSPDTSLSTVLYVAPVIGLAGIVFILFGGLRPWLNKPFIKRYAATSLQTSLRGHIYMRDLPEIDGLSRQQCLVVFNYYKTHSGSAFHGSLVEASMMAAIVLGALLGCAVGCVLQPDFWGGLLGLCVGLGLVFALFAILHYFIERYITLPKLRRFVQSDEGRRIIDQTSLL